MIQYLILPFPLLDRKPFVISILSYEERDKIVRERNDIARHEGRTGVYCRITCQIAQPLRVVLFVFFP
jgi:hypothetical protein